jgi:predicted GIY-YIG superfamily endonuclease
VNPDKNKQSVIKNSDLPEYLRGSNVVQLLAACQFASWETSVTRHAGVSKRLHKHKKEKRKNQGLAPAGV